MSFLSRLPLALKAVRQLGLRQVSLYARYQLGLRSGWYRRMERPPQPYEGELRPLFALPSRERLADVLGEQGRAQLLTQADAIVAGTITLFTNQPFTSPAPITASLVTEPPVTGNWSLNHWSLFETGAAAIPDAVFSGFPARDIKFLWEPARFGWAFMLGRAYRLTGDPKYADIFWQALRAFNQSNPPFVGPHWMSAQEVALRLMAFVWSGQVFADAACSTPERKAELVSAIAAHAQRIPSTLVYARAQNNNHLLSEATGLYTAALALPDHPDAKKWMGLGQTWLARGFREQIAPDGAYSQHSVNYHRLMLHLALWVRAISDKHNPLTKAATRLSAAVRWLLALTDPESGQAANLGANDGATILPLSSCAFPDQRPVLQAARTAFQGERPFEAGPWDELALWLALPLEGRRIPFSTAVLAVKRSSGSTPGAYPVLADPRGFSWVYLRAERFTSRPSHADQLHVDLWWQGVNIAFDPGTYLYNASAPWDNALTAARYHNTVTVDGREPFTRAGRFLYLDWSRARAEWTGSRNEVVASYCPVPGVRHDRSLSWSPDVWQVHDVLMLSGPRRERVYRLHWLIPYEHWSLEGLTCELGTPYGPLTFEVTVEADGGAPAASLVCEGRCLAGRDPGDPRLGWVSPIYGLKRPALSFAVEVASSGPVTFRTRILLPDRIWRKEGQGQ